MITTSEILDLGMSMIADNSATARSKMMLWLNAGMQEIVKMRPWRFLEASSTIALTNGEGAYPADFSDAISWTIGNQCIYPSARMSDSDAAETEYYDGNYRVVDDLTTFTIFPAPDSCVLKYRKSVPEYTDSTGSITVFPIEMKNVLARHCIARFYEYDVDERSVGALQLYSLALKEAKKWDNSLRPLPRRDKRSILWSNT